MRYRFIHVHQAEHRLTPLCRTLGVSWSGYYAWRRRPASARTRANAQLLEHLQQVFVASAVNRVWVGDLTAIATRSGWLYLAVLLDLYSRCVIGWAMSAKPDQHVALEALQMALLSHRPHQGLMHHTDQGATYTSVAYQQRLAEHGIAAGMSRKNHCYDNAVTESFFSTLKNDLVHDRDYHTHAEAWAERQRLHQTLGYVSPEQFETQNPVPLRGCLRNRG